MQFIIVDMIDLMTFLVSILAISNVSTAFFLFKKTKTQKKAPPPDFQEFLLDLMQGGAVLKVQRVNPEDVMLRSPRNR